MVQNARNILHGRNGIDSLKQLWIAGISLSFLLFQTPAIWARVGDTYGLGSIAGGLANSSNADPEGAFSSYLNPASLAIERTKKFELGIGYLFIQPNFKSISNITIQTPEFNDVSTNQTGTTSTDAASVLGQLIGFRASPWKDLWNLSVGFVAFIPLNHLATLDTGDAFLPQYALFRANGQTPEIDFGLGVRPWEHVLLGAGFHMAFSSESTAQLVIKTETEKASHLRFQTQVDPALCPYVSVTTLWGDEKPWVTALNLKFPKTYSTTLRVDANAEALSGLLGLGLDFRSNGNFMYDPMIVEAAVKIPYSTAAELTFALSYEAWGAFESPALDVQQNSGLEIAPSRNPSADTGNIFVPKIGHTFHFSEWNLRMGYQFRDTIFKDPIAKDNGNLLDPPKHTLAVGAGTKLGNWKLDAHFHFTYLVTQTISKSETFIGGPSYEAGGSLLGGGITASLEFE